MRTQRAGPIAAAGRPLFVGYVLVAYANAMTEPGSTASAPAAATAVVRVIEREEEHATLPKALPQALECTLPPGIAIRKNAYGYGLFATQDFAADALLYLTACLYVPDVEGTIPLRIQGTGQEFTLDMREHSVAQSDKPGTRQLYTFDGGWWRGPRARVRVH